jgi:hypothetical protein
VAEVEIPEIVAAAARETPLQVVVVELAHSNLKHTPLKDFHDFNQNAPLRALASVNSLELKLQELCDTVVKTLAASP